MTSILYFLQKLFVTHEGLGSYKRSKTYDTQIFSLAVLLSSVFIYNSNGTVDDGSLDKLSLVCELAGNIRVCNFC